VGLKVHFSVNAKWQFVYTVRLAPSRSDAPFAVSLKLRVYGEYLYLYLNSPILMPAACDCLKNVHRMSAIYLLHLLIFLSRCLQLGFRFLVFFFFYSISPYLSRGIPSVCHTNCQGAKASNAVRFADTLFARARPPYQYPFT